MERRVFLTGLIGVAGAAALASVAAAAPIARPLELLDTKPDGGAAPNAAAAAGARTPDGTPVDQAQVVVRYGYGPRRRYYRRHYRRYRRRCRTYWSYGRRITRCW